MALAHRVALHASQPTRAWRSPEGREDLERHALGVDLVLNQVLVDAVEDRQEAVGDVVLLDRHVEGHLGRQRHGRHPAPLPPLLEHLHPSLLVHRVDGVPNRRPGDEVKRDLVPRLEGAQDGLRVTGQSTC